MPLITLSSDIGSQDYLVSAVKAQLLQINPEFTIVDISHSIPPFNYPQAAYVCRSAIRNFPAFSYHIILVNLFEKITRLPQDPQNIMEEIICDADLDYLGRPDFFTIAQKLYLEMKAKGKVNTEKEWDQIQVGFLKSHKYFTSSSQQDREPLKSKHLQILEDRNHK